MSWKESELQYRQAALHSASPVGIVMMLYDQLVRDLRKAAVSIRESRFEACANEIKHALLIIQQLEGTLDRSTGEAFVPWLLRFYGLLRTKIVDAQIKCSPEDIEAQIALILDVREAWQQVETRNTFIGASAASPAMPSRLVADEGYASTNWSA